MLLYIIQNMEETFYNIPGLILFGDYNPGISNLKNLIAKIVSLIFLILYFFLSDESIKINNTPVILTIIMVFVYLLYSLVNSLTSLAESGNSIVNLITVIVLLSLLLFKEGKINNNVSIIILFCLYMLLESNINYKNSDYTCETKNNYQCKLKDIYTNPVINYITVCIIIILLIHQFENSEVSLKLFMIIAGLLLLNLLLSISNLVYVKDVKCDPQYNIETNIETKEKIKVFTYCKKTNENNKLVQLKKWSILLGIPTLLFGLLILYNYFNKDIEILPNLLQIIILVFVTCITVFYNIFNILKVNNKIYKTEDQNEVNSKNEFNLMVSKYKYLIIFAILISIIIIINPDWNNDKKDAIYLIFIIGLLSLLFTINLNFTFIIISSIVFIIIYLLIIINRYMKLNLLKNLMKGF